MKKWTLRGSKVVFTVCLLVSVAMMVAGFIIPPTGVIDGSVLTAVGELFGFAALGQLPTLIHGRSVALHHGQTTIHFNERDNEYDGQAEQGTEGL